MLYSDASKKGWGAFNETGNIRTGGVWSVTEQSTHINILELRACQLCLESFCKNVSHSHVRIFMDNLVCCAYINKFGGKKTRIRLYREGNMDLVHRKHTHLSAAHIPGKENCEADEESRRNNDDTEWSLQPEIFAKIHKLYSNMFVDLLASRLNYKLDRYVSRRPDP